MNPVKKANHEMLKKETPDFGPGDLVRVHHKIKEGDKEKVQYFQGNVIQIRGSGISKTFTVRKISHGIGVERIFPLHSPLIQQIEVRKRAKVRRAKLFYLRKKRGKAAKVREKKSEKKS